MSHSIGKRVTSSWKSDRILPNPAALSLARINAPYRTMASSTTPKIRDEMKALWLPILLVVHVVFVLGRAPNAQAAITDDIGAAITHTSKQLSRRSMSGANRSKSNR